MATMQTGMTTTTRARANARRVRANERTMWTMRRAARAAARPSRGLYALNARAVAEPETFEYQAEVGYDFFVRARSTVGDRSTDAWAFEG